MCNHYFKIDAVHNNEGIKSWQEVCQVCGKSVQYTVNTNGKLIQQ